MSVPGSKKWRFPEDNAAGAIMFNMITTAKEYGLTPYQFFALPSDEKAMMMVHNNVIAKMKAASATDTRPVRKAK